MALSQNTFLVINDLLCPAETLMHNCYFHGSSRSHSIHNRKYVLEKGSSCVDFSSFAFLDKFRNTSIYLVGDSTLMQLFSSLTCSLYKTAPYNINVGWYKHEGGTTQVRNPIYNRVTCPYGGLHCHFTHGVIEFPDFELKIELIFLIVIGSDMMIPNLIKDRGVRPQDIIMTAFGLHYKRKVDFVGGLRAFAAGLRMLPLENVPGLFYMESFPTHFGGNTFDAGYYEPNRYDQGCLPLDDTYLRNFTAYQERAYRSNLTLLENSPNLKIIRIAEGMNSQYDAHIDGDSTAVAFSQADCLHYCANSAVFDFLKTQIFNHWLGHRKKFV